MPELALLRHAKSDWSGSLPDRERPLNARGRRDARRIGRWLSEAGWTPDLILASPARRVRETLAGLRAETGWPESLIRWEDALYLAPERTLAERVRRLPDDRPRVLLIGHNPGLEQLLLWLAEQPPAPQDNGKLFTTANLALMELPCWHRLEPQGARLLAFVRPKGLDEA